MKAIKIVLALALVPSFARAEAGADKACRTLLQQARAAYGEGSLRCAAGDGLTVTASPRELGTKVQAAFFPTGSFGGYPARLADERRTAFQGESLDGVVAAKLPASAAGLSGAVNFDGAAAHQGDVAPNFESFDVLVSTLPPGSGGGNPPGSGGNPPGSGGGNPPGSGGDDPDGDDGGLPGGTQPPAPPVPVPSAPSVNWWNSHTPKELNAPLSGYGSDYKGTDEAITRWYPYNQYFYSTTRANGKATIVRTATDTETSYVTPLKSQETTQTRQCWYRAYYTLDSYGKWAFDRYEAACAVVRTDAQTPDLMTVKVDYDLQGQTILPWDKDVIVLNFDGSKVYVDQAGAAFKYAVSGPIVDQQNATATIGLKAGARVLRSPEKDKVTAWLQKDGADLMLYVRDDRSSFYAGEVLQVAIKIKKDSGSMWKRDAVVSENSKSGPLSIAVHAQASQTTKYKVSTTGAGKYYIDDWSFRRAGKKTSTEDWMWRGEGPKVSF